MTERATISREELKAELERGAPLFLFEVLPEPYYRKHHIPTARHMDPTDVVGAAAREVPDKSAPIVVYCWDEH